MLPLASSDGIDALGRKVERKTSGAAQHLAVSLEPARAAGEWQIAISNDDVRAGAGAGECAFLDPVARACHQDHPIAPTSLNHHCAERQRTIRPRPFGQGDRIGLHPCQFNQIVARVSRASVTQREQLPLAIRTRHGDPDLASIARDEQIWHRGHQCQHARQRHGGKSP
jgi:hypothetical protein